MSRLALLLAASLAGCSPQPRSASYFVAHRAEAARVVAACKTGVTRGPECQAAEAGTLAAEADAQKSFFKKSF
jgi:uncharacterized lipoprotein YmbA